MTSFKLTKSLANADENIFLGGGNLSISIYLKSQDYGDVSAGAQQGHINIKSYTSHEV